MLNQTFGIIVLGNPLNFTGMQVVNFGSGNGSVTAAGMFSLMSVGHIASGFIHCSGVLCSLAQFPPSQAIPLTSMNRALNFNGVLTGFPSVGPQGQFPGSGVGSMTQQGGFSAITLNGQEVSRQVVPEPGTGLLLGVGLAGFGMVTSFMRSRRNRD